jgi:hypothetical protein
MLSVKDFKKKARRTTEKAFEDLFAETLAESHVFSRHMSDKFSGVPDRYVRKGVWVELKSLEYARGQVPYGAGLSKEQRIVCGDLVGAGDEVWYLALITTNRGQYCVFMPMYIALGEPGNVTDVFDYREACHPWHFPYDGKDSLRKNLPLREWGK